MKFSGTSGAFALCEDCWANISVEDRVHYMRLVHGASDDWKMIELAIHFGDVPSLSRDELMAEICDDWANG